MLKILCCIFLCLVLISPAEARPLVVPNLLSKDISFVDPVSLTELSRLPVGFAPSHIAVSPDELFVYVISDKEPSTGLSAILKISLVYRVVLLQVLVSLPGKFTAVALSPNGERLLAVDRYQATLHAYRTVDLVEMYQRRLCQRCDGVTGPLFSTPRISVSPDSQNAAFAVPVDHTLQSIDIYSNSVTASHLLGLPGSSLAYGSASRFEMAPSFVLTAHPQFGIQATDTLSGWGLQLPLFASAITPAEILTLQLGANLFVIAGESAYESAPDSLKLFHVNSGAVVSYPSSEATVALQFNPQRLEVWSVCRSFPGVQQCNPFRIDIHNLAAPAQSGTVVGPVAASSGSPRFTPNYDFYLHPLPTLNQIMVVETATRNVLAPIHVGASPQGVF